MSLILSDTVAEDMAPHVEHQLVILERLGSRAIWWLDLDCVDCDVTIASVRKAGA